MYNPFIRQGPVSWAAGDKDEEICTLTVCAKLPYKNYVASCAHKNIAMHMNARYICQIFVKRKRWQTCVGHTRADYD